MSSIRFVTMFQKWVYEQHQNVCADFGIDYIYMKLKDGPEFPKVSGGSKCGTSIFFCTNIIYG